MHDCNYMSTLVSYISQVSPITDPDLTLLLSACESRPLKRGEVLLQEGQVCRALYLVEKGYLRTYYNKDGVEINLNFTFEGDFTTNFKSIKTKLPSELSIEAGEETAVWIFRLDALAGKVNTYPQIIEFIRRLAIRLLMASEDHSNLFKIYTPAERYQYIEKHNPQLLQRVSLSQLASYLGVTRETLSRIRSKTQL